MGPPVLLLCITFVLSPYSHKSVSVTLGTARENLTESYHGHAVQFLFCCMFISLFIAMLGLVVALVPNELDPREKRKSTNTPIRPIETKQKTRKLLSKVVQFWRGWTPMSSG